jgi:hypothetical protein
VNSRVARPAATHTDAPLKSEPSIRRGFRHPKDALTLSVSLASVLIYALLVTASALSQSPMAVLHTEGLVHGFLVLRTLEGNTIADGDVTQLAKGDRVTNHLVFRFKDGSIYEETVVFSQRNRFRVASDHLLQKGPTFKHPMEVWLEVPTGQVTVRYTEDDGKEKTITERLKLPSNVANGMTLTLLKNILPGVTQTTLSMVAATPKPRIVKLVISPEGEESFSIGGSNHKATRYLVKIQIGGVKGLVAPLVGKQPPDTHVWILGGDAPVFVKLEGPLYQDGPTWRIELTSPVWRND